MRKNIQKIPSSAKNSIDRYLAEMSNCTRRHKITYLIVEEKSSISKGLGKVNEIEFLRKSVSAVKTRPVNKPASTYNQKLLWFEKVKVSSSSLCEIIVKLPRKV